VLHRVVVAEEVSFIFPSVEKLAPLFGAGCGWISGSTFGVFSDIT
jgi:hypothetical protein